MITDLFKFLFFKKKIFWLKKIFNRKKITIDKNHQEIFKYCKLNFSKNVILDHSYNLYEFTVFVKK